MDSKNHRVHGQLKRKPADFTHIFSASTIDTILLLCHAFSCQEMYDVHRFDARNILWRLGIQLKKIHNILLYDAGQFYVKENKMAAE